MQGAVLKRRTASWVPSVNSLTAAYQVHISVLYRTRKQDCQKSTQNSQICLRIFLWIQNYEELSAAEWSRRCCTIKEKKSPSRRKSALKEQIEERSTMANYTVNFPEIPDSSTWIFLSPFVDKAFTFNGQHGHLSLNYGRLDGLLRQFRRFIVRDWTVQNVALFASH